MASPEARKNFNRKNSLLSAGPVAQDSGQSNLGRGECTTALHTRPEGPVGTDSGQSNLGRGECTTALYTRALYSRGGGGGGGGEGGRRRKEGAASLKNRTCTKG